MGALFMDGVFHDGKVFGNEVLEVMPPFILEQMKWKETLLTLKGNFVEMCNKQRNTIVSLHFFNPCFFQ